MRLSLVPGETTEWSVSLDNQGNQTGRLDVLDVGAWLDRLIRSAHATGHTVRAEVFLPPADCDLMTQVALRTLRRVFGIYDVVRVEWK